MSTAAPNPRLQRRIELGIRLAAPFLDVMLAVAGRLSRALAREHPDAALSAGMRAPGPAPRD